ncbi:MAG: DUF692 family protein [Bacteroidetes bacterium]|nr:DUF692 family protein [Bacteroidota bacterium]
MPFASIACNLDRNTLLAALPLLESGNVEGLEWSFDALFKVREIPEWFQELVFTYGKASRLIGHGVYFSIFSGKWRPEQENWLSQLRQFSKTYQFDHVSEHFGFMTGEDFHKGAPIGIPYNASTLSIGVDRLFRIQDACQCPVGLENLAFSYSLDEVKKHGDFLSKLVEPVNGFIILDLHNLFCQMHNFEVDFEELMALYPLERVREIHISGGSWEASNIVSNKKIRRDTHDSQVPETVFKMLESSLSRCPNLKFVVMEQLGNALGGDAEKAQFQADFLKMSSIIQHETPGNFTQQNDFSPNAARILGEPLENEFLAYQQNELSQILETSPNFETTRQLLANSSLANSDWKVENWEPTMLETAMVIAQKWKHGFV